MALMARLTATTQIVGNTEQQVWFFHSPSDASTGTVDEPGVLFPFPGPAARTESVFFKFVVRKSYRHH